MLHQLSENYIKLLMVYQIVKIYNRILVFYLRSTHEYCTYLLINSMIRITTLYSEFYLHTDLLMVKQTCMLAFTHAFVLTLKVQISPILAFGLNVPRVITCRNHQGRHTLAFLPECFSCGYVWMHLFFAGILPMVRAQVRTAPLLPHSSIGPTASHGFN
jgi:hypothetical protein